VPLLRKMPPGKLSPHTLRHTGNSGCCNGDAALGSPAGAESVMWDVYPAAYDTFDWYSSRASAGMCAIPSTIS